MREGNEVKSEGKELLSLELRVSHIWWEFQTFKVQGTFNRLLKRASSLDGGALRCISVLHVIQGGGKKNSVTYPRNSPWVPPVNCNKLAQWGGLQGHQMKPEVKRKLLQGTAVLLSHILPVRPLSRLKTPAAPGLVESSCPAFFIHAKAAQAPTPSQGTTHGASCFAWFKHNSLWRLSAFWEVLPILVSVVLQTKCYPLSQVDSSVFPRLLTWQGLCQS